MDQDRPSAAKAGQTATISLATLVSARHALVGTALGSVRRRRRL